MLSELIVCLSIFAGLFAISYPTINATMESVEEQAEIRRTLKRHNDNYSHFRECNKPTKLGDIWYYPNGTVSPHILYTKKHKIVIGKYNTVRVERQR